jgi:hypothetical protein
VPRHVFIDFRSSFGSYLSTFNLPEHKPDPSLDHWPGRVHLTEQDRVRKQAFQKELEALDEGAEYQDQEEEEERKEK